MTADEIKDRIGNRRVVASVSGGKDSAAMSLYLRELGIDHDRVFCDTGWEHRDTYTYLRGELTRVLGPIVEIRAEKQMVERIRERQMFPRRLRRFCTQELKVFPLQKHLAGYEAEVLNAVGIRSAESGSRAKMPEWECAPGFDCETWRPILAWSLDDVIAIHKRHGLAPNPLYLQGASRVGCWPCIYARKAEVRHIADTDPARIDLIRALEAELTASARARKPSELEKRSDGRAWFQARTGGGGEPWPIDKVVQWSRTSRGGRQFELFAPTDGDAGCMRWGLCEVASEG